MHLRRGAISNVIGGALAILVFCAIGLRSAASAGPLEDAMAAVKKGDYSTASGLLRPLAEGGNASAQLMLGALYADGTGVPVDYVEAAEWFRRAAEQGNGPAQAELGRFYADGVGVRRDYGQAAKWLQRAVAHDGAEARWGTTAKLYLGNLYAEGRGVLQDYVEAAKWFRSAAEQGEAEAQFRIGALYREGLGVPQDSLLAHMWFNLAAGQGNESARHQRDMVARRMTPEQIAEAQRLARDWKPGKRDEWFFQRWFRSQ